MKLSKRFSDDKGGGEVDYKTKSGTAWSHNFLNQKPWHPLSYPNQRRKWIAEQTHAHRERHAEEVAREASTLPFSPSTYFQFQFQFHNTFFAFFSMLRSKSFIAKHLSSPRRRRKRFQFLPFLLCFLSWVAIGFLRFLLCLGRAYASC